MIFLPSSPNKLAFRDGAQINSVNRGNRPRGGWDCTSPVPDLYKPATAHTEAAGIVTVGTTTQEGSPIIFHPLPLFSSPRKSLCPHSRYHHHHHHCLVGSSLPRFSTSPLASFIRYILRTCNMNRTARLNADSVSLLAHGDCDGAVKGIASALASITHYVTGGTPQPKSRSPQDTVQPLTSAICRVKTSLPYLGMETRSSSVTYFERPFLIESGPNVNDSQGDGMTDEQAAYCSSVCFYNMGLALYTQYKKETLKYDRLIKANDCFIRSYDLLAACQLEPDDSKLVLLLATCNNLAALQGDLGNIVLLQYWAQKFEVVLGFMDAPSHWNDANYHSFRLKKLLNAFAFSSAATA